MNKKSANLQNNSRKKVGAIAHTRYLLNRSSDAKTNPHSKKEVKKSDHNSKDKCISVDRVKEACKVSE